MYDVPGADSGREWVEVTNTGTAPASLAGYKFFENGTNHGLATVMGTSTLAAGESAVIADVPAKFLADWPKYSGVLFDSAFSLSNAGETLALKDQTPTVVDSVTYASPGGAAGDGNSLHRVGETLVAGAPNPGVYTGSAPAPIVVATKSSPTATAATSATTKKTAGAKTSAVVAAVAEAAPASAPAPTDNPLLVYGLGAGALFLIIAAGAGYSYVSAQTGAPPRTDANALAQEFELVE